MITEEHNIQSQCVQWYKLNYTSGIIFSVPNAGKRSIAALNWLKQEGMCIGAPDLVVMQPVTLKILFIEFKTDKGKQSQAQKEFQKKCDNLDTNLYYVCRSLDEFIDIIESGKS